MKGNDLLTKLANLNFTFTVWSVLFVLTFFFGLGIFVIVDHFLKVKTKGTVISVSDGKALVMYQVDGEYRTFTLITTKRKVGDTMTIMYTKGRPDHVQIGTQWYTYVAIPMVIVSGILIVVVFKKRNSFSDQTKKG